MQLSGHFSRLMASSIKNPPGHVIHPTSFTPGNWNFYDISMYKKVSFLGLPGPFAGRILPEPQDSSKISKAGHFGAKNLWKTHSKHFPTVWEKKNLAEKRIFGGVKKGPFLASFEARRPLLWAWMAERGVSNLVLAQNERLDQVSSKSESGRRQLIQ